MNQEKFWKWQNGVSSEDSKLILEGAISSEDWWEDGLDVTPQAFRDELSQHNGNLTVAINSPGGDVFAGVSIYNTLSAYDKGTVTVEVNGLAASIASVIAMAGDKVIMLPGSSMMIHKPWSVGIGNADELVKVAEVLNSIEESLVPIYTARTGLSEERIKEMLAEETWLTPQEAVDLGFADELVEPKKKVGLSASFKNALTGGQFAFSMSATKESMEKIIKKLQAKSQNTEEEDISTTEQPVDEDNQVEDKTTIETANAEENKTDEVTEPPVEVNNSVKKEKKEMQDEIATEGIVAQAPTQAVKPVQADISNYLKSEQAVKDFAEVLRANAGKTASDVKSAWKDVLVKNGLADTDYFTLPDPLVTNIETAIKSSGLYNLLNHTGLDVFRVDIDTENEDAETSRAGGHKKGDTKDQEVLSFEKRVIRAQYIYKYLVLNKEDIRENQSTGALIRFVLTELPTRVIREIERAVVIGDGRASNAKRKINSFVSIKSDVLAGNQYATSYTPVAGESRYASIIKAIDEIDADGAVYLISKKGFLTGLKLEQGVNGGFLFAPGADVVSALGLAGSFEPTWFKDANDAQYDAYLVVLSAYKTVGDNSMESFTNFKLETNENEFLQEIYKGGALSMIKSAVGIAKQAAS